MLFFPTYFRNQRLCVAVVVDFRVLPYDSTVARLHRTAVDVCSELDYGNHRRARAHIDCIFRRNASDHDQIRYEKRSRINLIYIFVKENGAALCELFRMAALSDTLFRGCCVVVPLLLSHIFFFKQNDLINKFNIRHMHTNSYTNSSSQANTRRQLRQFVFKRIFICSDNRIEFKRDLYRTTMKIK